jgi:hypothetical protein
MPKTPPLTKYPCYPQATSSPTQNSEEPTYFYDYEQPYPTRLDKKPEVLPGENAAVLDLAAALHSALVLIHAHIHCSLSWP